MHPEVTQSQTLDISRLPLSQIIGLSTGINVIRNRVLNSLTHDFLDLDIGGSNQIMENQFQVLTESTEAKGGILPFQNRQDVNQHSTTFINNIWELPTPWTNNVTDLFHIQNCKPYNPVCDNRLLLINDTIVSSGFIDRTPITLPQTPSWVTHKVFEFGTFTPAPLHAAGRKGLRPAPTAFASFESIYAPAAARRLLDNEHAIALQLVIDTAANYSQTHGETVIVHVNNYYWDLRLLSIVLPANTSLWLVGDGNYYCVLRSARAGPQIIMRGPSLAQIRHLDIIGGVLIDQADQPDGRIAMIGINGPQGIAATNIEQTILEVQTSSGPGPLWLTNVRSFLTVGSGNVGSISLLNHSNLVMMDTWHEGSQEAWLRGDSGSFTFVGGVYAPACYDDNLCPHEVDVNGFDGQITVIALSLLGPTPSQGVYIHNPTPSTKVLFLGCSTSPAVRPELTFHFDNITIVTPQGNLSHPSTTLGAVQGFWQDFTIGQPIPFDTMFDRPSSGPDLVTRLPPQHDAFIMESLAHLRTTTFQTVAADADQCRYTVGDATTNVFLYRVGAGGITIMGGAFNATYLLEY